MRLIIIPYEGDSEELTNVLKRHSVVKKKCENGKCPIPKPFRLLSNAEIRSKVEMALKTAPNAEISIVSCTKEDKSKLSNVNWGLKCSVI